MRLHIQQETYYTHKFRSELYLHSEEAFIICASADPASSVPYTCSKFGSEMTFEKVFLPGRGLYNARLHSQREMHVRLVTFCGGIGRARWVRWCD